MSFLYGGENPRIRGAVRQAVWDKVGVDNTCTNGVRNDKISSGIMFHTSYVFLRVSI